MNLTAVACRQTPGKSVAAARRRRSLDRRYVSNGALIVILLVIVLALGLFILNTAALAEDDVREAGVELGDIAEAPQEFDGQMVAVTGFVDDLLADRQGRRRGCST